MRLAFSVSNPRSVASRHGCSHPSYQVSLPTGAGGIPAFGLEPKFARTNFHRGSAPLASLRSCHPDDVGKFFSHTLLGFESLPSSKLT